MSNYHFKLKSANAKTGPLPVTVTSEDTCPPSCEMRDTCYAKQSFSGMHWRKVSAGERGGTLTELAAHIRTLPEGQVWRHNVAGDLPGKEERINGASLRKLTSANTGRRGFTYTHKLPHVADNAAHIARANRDGFTVNLSANNLAQADAYVDLDIAPVVVVLPHDADKNTHTPNGTLVVVCPATQRDDVTCASCKMCAVGGRSFIVGFPGHGNKATHVDIIARG